MININKKTFVIIGIGFIIIAVAIFFLTREPGTKLYEKERLTIEQDLVPIELSEEEQQALQEEGIEILSEEDALANDLQNVRTSDELDAIEADLNETDLSELDAELELISNDLLEL